MAPRRTNIDIGKGSSSSRILGSLSKRSRQRQSLTHTLRILRHRTREWRIEFDSRHRHDNIGRRLRHRRSRRVAQSSAGSPCPHISS